LEFGLTDGTLARVIPVIKLLADHFLKKYPADNQKPVCRISPEAVDLMIRTRSGATRPARTPARGGAVTCLGGTDLVAFTLGRALADPEVIEISERPNRLSYCFQ